MEDQPELNSKYDGVTSVEKIFSVFHSYRESLQLMENCLCSSIPLIPLVDRRIKLCKIEIQSLEREKHSDYYKPSRDEPELKEIEVALKKALGELEEKRKELVSQGYLSSHEKEALETRICHAISLHRCFISNIEEHMNSLEQLTQSQVNSFIKVCNSEIELLEKGKNSGIYENLGDDPRLKEIESALTELLPKLNAKKQECQIQRKKALEYKVSNRTNIYNYEIAEMAKCLNVLATTIMEIIRNISSCKHFIGMLEKEKKSGYYEDLVNDPKVENVHSSLIELMEKLETKKSELEAAGQKYSHTSDDTILVHPSW